MTCILRVGRPYFRSRLGARVSGPVIRIPGIHPPANAVEKRRSFPLQALTEGTALSYFLAILDWAIRQLEIEGKDASATANAPSTEVQ